MFCCGALSLEPARDFYTNQRSEGVAVAVVVMELIGGDGKRGAWYHGLVVLITDDELRCESCEGFEMGRVLDSHGLWECD